MGAFLLYGYCHKEEKAVQKELEVIKGHNPDDYVWIRPIIINLKEDTITLIRDEISIQTDSAEAFFGYFFEKYYNNNICFNRHFVPIRGSSNDKGRFDWWFCSHIFPYHNVRDMLKEMSEFADKLEKDYDDLDIQRIVHFFSFCYACEVHDHCTIHEDAVCYFKRPEFTKNRQRIAVSYFRRFIEGVTEIMDRHPETQFMEFHTP